jgi:hypothetical protein
MNDELVHLTRHDPLTGLANRTLFAERLSAGLECGHQGGELTLMLIDLDGFKVVNDLRGHPAGDAPAAADLPAGLPDWFAGTTPLRGSAATSSPSSSRARRARQGRGIARRISEALLAPFDIEGRRSPLARASASPWRPSTAAGPKS